MFADFADTRTLSVRSQYGGYSVLYPLGGRRKHFLNQCCKGRKYGCVCRLCMCKFGANLLMFLHFFLQFKMPIVPFHRAIHYFLVTFEGLKE